MPLHIDYISAVLYIAGIPVTDGIKCRAGRRGAVIYTEFNQRGVYTYIVNSYYVNGEVICAVTYKGP